MVSLDTNVLLRLVIGDAPDQTAAAERFTGHGAWVSVVVLVEAAWVLTTIYGLSRRELAATMERIARHRVLAMERPEAVAAAIESFNRTAGVSFADCLILELARGAGHLPLGTYDRALAKLPDVEHIR
jgi:predicted nucleic-acid-binding protein